MPFILAGNTGEKNEEIFNAQRANKFTDATIPLSGSGKDGQQIGCVPVTGACPVMVGPLTYGMLYEFTSKAACRIVSTTNIAFSATFSGTFRSYQYVPANYSKFHIPVSGASEYVLVFNEDGSNVDASLAIVERTE